MAFNTMTVYVLSGVGLLFLIQHALGEIQTVQGSPKLANLNTVAIEKGNSSNDSSETEKLSVKLSSDKLSLIIDNQPLHQVVKSIAGKANISIILDGAISNVNVDIRFDSLPIPLGLQQLFESYDTFFFFSNQADTKAKLATVWVYPKAKGESLSPKSGNDVAACPALLDATNYPDSLKRAEALANIIQRNDSETDSALQLALGDSDEKVRINALQAATLINLDIPSDQLKNLALDDPSSAVRTMAIDYLLQQLGNSRIAPEDVAEIANSALTDPAQTVVETAKQTLASLDDTVSGIKTANQADVYDPQLVISP